MTARAIMVLGTSSHVGKSLVTAALCRIFARAGYRVAPFKAQNMALNSAATPDGREIGRAQALQAEAAGVAPSVHMNPVLIKPGSDTAAQIVVQGEVWRNLDARNYQETSVAALLPIVEESYRLLAAQHDVIVLEGAGSPAEINLKENDIVNMRMAKLADAQCLLVGDIDRGGVFASLLGTCELLDEDERGRIAGFVINKFRGDVTLLWPGIRMIEQRLGKSCMGVIPYLANLSLDEEDSVGLRSARFGAVDGAAGACAKTADWCDRLSLDLQLHRLRSLSPRSPPWPSSTFAIPMASRLRTSSSCPAASRQRTISTGCGSADLSRRSTNMRAKED